jgi:hypothetical protein
VAAIRVTKAAASDFLRLAQRLELEKAAAPDHPSKEEIAHFLMRLVFCLFADSVGLLPNHTFRRMVTGNRHSPISFNRMLPQLFQAMSEENSFFGPDNIPYFNGGLFSDNRTIPLDYADLGVLHSATQHDWSHIEPVIFGTLFERSLDEAKRSMIGAHYTSPDDILLLIEPVVMDPLKRHWEIVKQSVLDALDAEASASTSASASAANPGAPSSLLSSRSGAEGSAVPNLRRPAQSNLKLQRPALTLLQAWATELTQVRILDPACGSGNFLYIALKRLLDLWDEARIFGIAHGLTLALDPIPHPGQLFGIEIDFYAHEIASIVVWIGFLQWKYDHGVKDNKEPLLQKLTNIEQGDAILRYDSEGKPYEPTWPEADYIVGNPPFLGGNRLRQELARNYVDALQMTYSDRVPANADLVTYWFEKARASISRQPSLRAGLLATQAIRGGANRKVLEAIKISGDIFMAWSDRPWQLEGAAVHVSMIGFDNGTSSDKVLDGQLVKVINADLTHLTDATTAMALSENKEICFRADEKGGPFDIGGADAERMLAVPANVNGRPNSDVIHRWANALDVTRRPRNKWIIDFFGMSEREAAFYEMPFHTLKERINSEQSSKKNGNSKKRVSLPRQKWWLHRRPGSEMRAAVAGLERFIVTGSLGKHRHFVWLDSATLPDHQLYVFARADDYFFGTLSSNIHEIWALHRGTQLEDRPRYTPETTFLTFPFPWPPGTELSESEDPRVRAIADAARELVRLRDAWLNPPDTATEELKKRTLTNLYNERPTWLSNAHRTLDEAVFAAYGWPSNLTTQQILANLLALNHERAAARAPAIPKPSKPKKPRATTSSRAKLTS